MSIEFDASQDFSASLDGLESVTLRRRESGEVLQISSAWRRNARTRESESSDGTVVQSDVEWSVQLPDGAAHPELGDMIVSADKASWTILNLEQQVALGRWTCSTRELRIAFGCDDVVDVQRAEWDDLGGGLEIVGWTDLFTAMPVRIQPTNIEVSDTSLTPGSTERFTIVLGEPFPLEAYDRFVGPDGAIYRLESIEQTERIDKLPIARVIKVSG